MADLLQIVGFGLLVVIAFVLATRRREAPPRADPVTHANRQRTALDGAEVRAAPIFNRSEARLFGMIREAIDAAGAPLFVMGQTSMGAMIRTSARDPADRFPARNAYEAVNSKRVDFALVDAGGAVRLVVEFDGPSHARPDAKARDAVKEAALAKAGVPLLRIDHREDEAAMRRRLAEAIAGLDRPGDPPDPRRA